MEETDQKEDIVGVLQRSLGSESETGVCACACTCVCVCVYCIVYICTFQYSLP